MLSANEFCRVCDSAYTLYAQDVLGQRTQDLFAQRYCMDCHSFWHTSGYVESPDQQRDDFEELSRERDNHSALQYQLALELFTRVPHTKSVLEIGHGLGLFLRPVLTTGEAPPASRSIPTVRSSPPEISD